MKKDVNKDRDRANDDPRESDSSCQPELTLAHILQRRLDPIDPKHAVSALLPDTVWDKISVVSPEQLVSDDNVPLGIALIRLREGVLHLIASDQLTKRRYILAAYKLACRYKGNERAANDLLAFVAYHTNLKVPKTIEPDSRTILELMLNFQFVATKYAKQNTVTRWFNGLWHYFEHDISIERIAHLINIHGPESLYKHSVERRKFEEQRALKAETFQPTFKEIDELQPIKVKHGVDTGSDEINKNYKRPAEQQDEVDLPPADLDKQSAEIGEDDESPDEEYFDVEEAMEMVRKSIILSMQLGSACTMKGEVDTKNLALLAIRLSTHLTELSTLMSRG